MIDALRHSLFRGAALAALVTVLAGPVVAQTATAPAAAPAAPIPDVGQPEPPASALAAARALVLSSGMARSFAPMVPQLMDQIVPMLTRTRPELKANLTEVLKVLLPEFTKKGDDMVDIAAHIYARRMSEPELKASAAFFESAIGQKYVEVQPQMLDELVVAMQSWTQQLSGFMMQRVHDEMKKKGQDF